MAVVLDVTRTLSPKSIETPTGIDRVERAYVEHFLNTAPDALYVFKSGRQNHLIDRDVMSETYAHALSGDQEAGMSHGKSYAGVWDKISRLFGEHLSFPTEFIYLNVGHTNLSQSWLGALRKAGARKTFGLVHDMIPMDTPEFQTPKSAVRFEARMRALSAGADLVFANSEHTKDRSEHWFGQWGDTPQIVVNPLGVEPLVEVAPIPSDRPYFVILGTIEPRKNHALLLKVWAGFADIPEPDRPVLHIIGRRGWMNEQVFETLDRSTMIGRDVFEHQSLTDEDVAAYLRGAQALLFPSFSEGYGLPLLEAISAGIPTMVSDIPVFHELAGSVSLYLNPFDDNDWRQAIIKQIKQGNSGANSIDGTPFRLPSWADHFAKLERHL